MAASIVVGGNQAMLWSSSILWQTFPYTAGEEASITWTQTPINFLGEMLIDHYAALALQPLWPLTTLLCLYMKYTNKVAFSRQ